MSDWIDILGRNMAAAGRCAWLAPLMDALFEADLCRDTFEADLCGPVP